MGREDKIIESAKNKSIEKVKYLKDVVDIMIEENVAVTFYSVWKRSGLSKSFIYNNPEVVAYINEHKSEKKYNSRVYTNESILIDRIDELEHVNRMLRKELRRLQSDSYQHLLTENQVLKKRLEKYEELVKQGIIKSPENDL